MRKPEKKRRYRPRGKMLDIDALAGLAGIMKKFGVAGLRPLEGALEFTGLKDDDAPAFEKEVQLWMTPAEGAPGEARACRG